MNEPATNHESRQGTQSARLSICDAELLIVQYENRNLREVALDAAQRKAWAREAATVLRDLAVQLHAIVGPSMPVSAPYVVWNAEMREGRRPVTYKVRDG